MSPSLSCFDIVASFISFHPSQFYSTNHYQNTPTAPRLSHQTHTPIRRRRPWTSQASSTSSSDEQQEEKQPASSTSKDNTELSDLSLPNLMDMFNETGRPDCEQCKGDGHITCVVCNGTGFFSLTMMNMTSASTCRLCRGRRSIPCPTCRTIVFKSIMWWDQIPDDDEDPEGKWRKGTDGGPPRIQWGGPPNQP